MIVFFRHWVKRKVLLSAGGPDNFSTKPIDIDDTTASRTTWRLPRAGQFSCSSIYRAKCKKKLVIINPKEDRLMNLAKAKDSSCRFKWVFLISARWQMLVKLTSPRSLQKERRRRLHLHNQLHITRDQIKSSNTTNSGKFRKKGKGGPQGHLSNNS